MSQHMEPSVQPPAPQPPSQGSLGVNVLARSYQPRRLRAAVVSIAWNLLCLAAFLFSGAAATVQDMLRFERKGPTLEESAVYVAAFFLAYALLNFPLDLWYGYLHERQFALVKQGLRAWGWDWLRGVTQHGVMFFVGCMILLLLREIWPLAWVIAAAVFLLFLFFVSVYFAADLLPHGLFEFEHPDEQLTRRLSGLLPSAPSGKTNVELRLPPILLFAAAELRDFSGGLMGLGRRQLLLISRPTVELASNSLLRFIVIHELGHRHFRHLAIATLLAWAYATAGLAVSNFIIERLLPWPHFGPIFIPWLALFFTLWMVGGQPLLAYVGRRFEYQADRFYLDHGGTLAEMQAALQELSQRNLARTDIAFRRQSLFEAIPAVQRRLNAARLHVDSVAPKPTVEDR